MLLFAGHETTSHLIANGLYLLLRHTDERDRLIDSPNLGHSAIEELLRYESPVQWQTRMALEDIEVSGHPIPRGNRIFLMLGAANRDPRQFARTRIGSISRGRTIVTWRSDRERTTAAAQRSAGSKHWSRFERR